MFQAAQTQRAADLIVDQIREAILLCDLAPGYRLESERELAVTFDASRATVRDALATLEELNLVERKVGNGGGTFVLPITSQAKVRDPNDLVEKWPALVETLEFRDWLEPLAAEVACQRISDEKLAELTRIVDFSRRPNCTHEEFRTADIHFHLMIAEAAQNSFLSRSIRQIRVSMNSLLDLMQFSASVTQQTIAEHSEVLSALHAHDGDTARSAMFAHVHHTHCAVMARFGKPGARRPATVDESGGR
ncbi:FCD domain-containing protein [Pseudonocardia ailaonensis]|uniref:FCD domain-containing protein n=1 Tax=Pseudonocardia ailaonensis TaxID=367279 RepID=A0ABN2NAJ9_9PSEU